MLQLHERQAPQTFRLDSSFLFGMTNASTATIPRARLGDYPIPLWKEVISITTGSRASPEGLLSLLPKELQGIIADEQYCLRIFR